jgi:hypothetical protein
MRGLYQVDAACVAFMDSRGMERGRKNHDDLFDKTKRRQNVARGEEERLDRIARDMGQA